MQRTRLNGGARRAARWAAIATGVFATSLLWLTPRVTDAQMYFPFPYIADTELQVQNGAGDEVPSVGGVHRLMLRAFQQTLWLYGAMSDTDYMLTVPVVDGDYVSFTGWTTDGGTTAATDRYWVRKWTLPADLDPGLYAAHCTIDDPGLVADDPSGQIGVQLALAAVTEVVWQKHHATNRDLDDCPNNNGSKRIFPDKLTYNDAYPSRRDRVSVKATVEPPIAGITVYFRVWDVDDPSSTTPPIDPSGAITGPDNRGQAAWVGEPIGEATTTATTDSNGLATATLIVSMKPGDNYRVTAACINHSTGLGSQGSADFGLTPPVGAMTEMLTVWRSLHIERDAMGAPSPGEIFGVVTGNSTALSSHHTGSGYLEDDAADWGPTHSEWLVTPYPCDQLIGAVVDPNRSDFDPGRYVVWQNSADTVFTLHGTPPDITANASSGDPYRIDTEDTDPGGALPPAPTDTIVASLQEAYIEARFDTGEDTSDVPFRRNGPTCPFNPRAPQNHFDYYPGGAHAMLQFLQQHQGVSWDTRYFGGQLVTCYEGCYALDGDPNPEAGFPGCDAYRMYGCCWPFMTPPVAAVFLETTSEGPNVGPALVAAHEIGHMVGADDHADPCLMGNEVQDTFCADCQHVIRQWAGGAP